MARPKNAAQRDALLTAAGTTFAAQGLRQAEAALAREAGASAGSPFVPFETKTVLVNELYISLKTEMGDVATAGLDLDASPHDQLRHMWDDWIAWALNDPDRRRSLAH